MLTYLQYFHQSRPVSIHPFGFQLLATYLLSCYILVFTQDLEDFAVGPSRHSVSAEHSVVVRGVQIMSKPAVGSLADPGNIASGK